MKDHTSRVRLPPDAPGPLVEQLMQIQPKLQRVLETSMPPALRERLGSVTVHQLGALGFLPPTGATMRQFAEAVGISGAAATALADRMIKQGLAERRSDPGDRRTVLLAPTEQALKLLSAFRVWQREAMAVVLGRLEPAQLAIFAEVLTVLSEQPLV